MNSTSPRCIQQIQKQQQNVRDKCILQIQKLNLVNQAAKHNQETKHIIIIHVIQLPY